MKMSIASIILIFALGRAATIASCANAEEDSTIARTIASDDATWQHTDSTDTSDTGHAIEESPPACQWSISAGVAAAFIGELEGAKSEFNLLLGSDLYTYRTATFHRVDSIDSDDYTIIEFAFMYGKGFFRKPFLFYASAGVNIVTEYESSKDGLFSHSGDRVSSLGYSFGLGISYRIAVIGFGFGTVVNVNPLRSFAGITFNLCMGDLW